MRNFTTSLTAIALLMLAALGCATSGSAGRSSRGPTNGIHVTAVDLVAAYKENEVAADSKYKDQALAVTGTVESIGKDILDTMYVTLSSGEKYGFSQVQCMFDDSHKSELSALRKGVVIQVVGICKGKLGNVLLRQCSITASTT